MPEKHPWILYSIIVLGMMWLASVAIYLTRRNAIQSKVWLDIAMLVWPLCLLDEVIAMINGPLTLFYGATDWVPVLLMALYYRALKPVLVARLSRTRYLLWLPVLLCVLIQLPFAFSGIAEKHMIIETTPVGHPLDFWPVYASAMISGFAVLVISLLMTELVQKYHKHLPDQVVTPARYQLHWIAGALGTTVGLTMIGILLVTAVTFGFLHIVAWQTGLDLVVAAVMLALLYLLTVPQRTSPSVLDYHVMEDAAAGQDDMRRAISRAWRVVSRYPSASLSTLTIKEVAEQAQVDATTLALATRLLEKQSFSEFAMACQQTSDCERQGVKEDQPN